MCGWRAIERSLRSARQRRVRAAVGDVEQGRGRERGGDGVAGVWAGSGVWGLAAGREREM
jgi:hypothetical protein